MLNILIEKFGMKNSRVETEIYKPVYNEYLLVLNPNESVCEKIQKVRSQFAAKYKIDTSKYAYPNIALVNFLQFKIMESRLIHRLNLIAMGYHPFTVSLKGYGSFPNHTIFLNIESRQRVRNLIKELAAARRLMTLNKENKPHFIDDPHITLAGKLLPWQYEQSWDEYSHKNFTSHFISESMVLLKRPLAISADGHTIPGKYQKMMQFKFMNLPVTTKQGELFN